jgi:hypothetical protein
MQWLQTAYTVWFNRRHGLSGHLFGGRYKAVLIDQGAAESKMLYGYLGTVLDYLHLNPVRAGIVGARSSQGLLGLSLQPAEAPELGVRGSGILSFWIEG